MSTTAQRIIRYAFWAPGTTRDDGTIVPTHYDDMYVERNTPGKRGTLALDTPGSKGRVWNVQDMGISDRLAFEIPREHAAKWLRIRRTAPNKILTSGYLSRDTGKWSSYPITVPHMPVFEYAEAGKVVLHEGPNDSLHDFGYQSGTTAEGSAYSEQRITVENRDDFHYNTECDEHGRPKCVKCGHLIWELSPDCPQAEFPDCPGCMAVYECETGNCTCVDRLEQCSICDRDLGDGDTAWLCMDGGEFVCDEHVVIDERPDSLFKKVGAIRGEMLPAFAWPGGYCLVYYTKGGSTVCHECASQVAVSDPATEADVDEEMNCLTCDDAQSMHRRIKVAGLDQVNGDDVGDCEADRTTEDDYGREIYSVCNCEKYMPPTCDDCNQPIDPALRIKQGVTA